MAYVTQLQKMDANPSEWRCPEGFEKGTQGMNFLDPENSYHYPWGHNPWTRTLRSC